MIQPPSYVAPSSPLSPFPHSGISFSRRLNERESPLPLPFTLQQKRSWREREGESGSSEVACIQQSPSGTRPRLRLLFGGIKGGDRRPPRARLRARSTLSSSLSSFLSLSMFGQLQDVWFGGPDPMVRCSYETNHYSVPQIFRYERFPVPMPCLDQDVPTFREI